MAMQITLAWVRGCLDVTPQQSLGWHRCNPWIHQKKSWFTIKEAVEETR
jgi:hypothetical protein